MNARCGPAAGPPRRSVWYFANICAKFEPQPWKTCGSCMSQATCQAGVFGAGDGPKDISNRWRPGNTSQPFQQPCHERIDGHVAVGLELELEALAHKWERLSQSRGAVEPFALFGATCPGLVAQAICPARGAGIGATGASTDHSPPAFAGGKRHVVATVLLICRTICAAAARKNARAVSPPLPPPPPLTPSPHPSPPPPLPQTTPTTPHPNPHTTPQAPPTPLNPSGKVEKKMK